MGIRQIMRNRNEEGSIAIFVVVVLVSTGLVLTTATTVEFGLRSSRRGGDSANALQVADAGVNDALTAIQDAGSASFTRTGVVGTGSYSYTATQDPANEASWLVDVYGTDQTGVQRHVRARVTGQPLFASPMYIQTSYSATAGAVLDSFTSGSSLIGPSGNYTDGGCTDKGYMFFNPNANVTFQSGSGGGGGTSVNNCNKQRFGNSWDFSLDGCIQYGGVYNLPSSVIGSGKCPDPNHPTYPGRTKAIDQDFTVDVEAPSKSTDVDFPTQSPCANPDGCAPVIGTSFTCDAGNMFTAGKTYYYSSVTLKDGCGVNPSSIPATADPTWAKDNAVEVYAESITLATGTKGKINAPPVSSVTGLCGSSTSTWSYQDTNNNPASYYCSGWVMSLALNVLKGGAQTISISGNGGSFWGTFRAPTASVELKSPNMEFWGAMIAGNLTVKNQFSWHYDDALSAQTTGKYSIANWREEPL